MCHIFCSTHQYTNEEIKRVETILKSHHHRGPEDYNFKRINKNVYLAFHRLAINGLTSISSQPIQYKQYHLICNGEIYNYKQLWNYVVETPKTQSDCEVIIHLFIKYGLKQTSSMIDGVFSFCIYNELEQSFHISRDPLGIRPLYYWKFHDNHTIFGCSSTLNPIIDIYQTMHHTRPEIHVWTPGTCGMYDIQKKSLLQHKYWSVYSIQPLNVYQHKTHILNNIQYLLTKSVEKRIQNTERPIACLLSGGLDSSLICSIVQSLSSQPIETYSIGFEGSPDLKYARKVSTYLGTKHTEIICTEQEFINEIPKVIERIGSYDTTTIRASVGNYLVCKYIKQNSNAKVIFNGDGSDELCGGYLYFNHSPTDLDFDIECKRLLHDIHRFDVLRSDRCISSHGLEARTPFLDKTFVQYYLSLPIHHRRHQTIEKYLLRKAFEHSSMLPYDVLWRTKEAFSDGVSKHTRSWYQIIQEYLNIHLNIKPYKHLTLEQTYYRKCFEHIFGEKNIHLIPYYWMPRFIKANDASARTIFNTTNQE